MKKPYTKIIDQLNLLKLLSKYNPTPIGTPPLNIQINTSDIDIACTATNLTEFVSTVTSIYSNQSNFSSDFFQTRGKDAARCSFEFNNWEIELFCQTIPIEEQWGVRHFEVEKRLLILAPEIKCRVVQLKRNGLKTEPAFADILGLIGDPFEAVLALENVADVVLIVLLLRYKPQPVHNHGSLNRSPYCHCHAWLKTDLID